MPAINPDTVGHACREIQYAQSRALQTEEAMVVAQLESKMKGRKSDEKLSIDELELCGKVFDIVEAQLARRVV